MGLFVHGRHADTKIIEWAMRPELFVKRAAFAMMAAYGFANKQALNHEFEAFLPLVVNGALDDRHYVKKSVSWAGSAVARTLGCSSSVAVCRLLEDAVVVWGMRVTEASSKEELFLRLLEFEFVLDDAG